MVSYDCINRSRSRNVVLSTRVSPSSRKRTRRVPCTLRAGVPYDVLSTTPGNARPSCTTVSYVLPLLRLLVLPRVDFFLAGRVDMQHRSGSGWRTCSIAASPHVHGAVVATSIAPQRAPSRTLYTTVGQY